jgi:hypothetical protein
MFGISLLLFPSWVGAARPDSSGTQTDSLPPYPDTSYFDFGGALRFNAFVKDWEGEDDNRNRGGDLAFDTWMINVEGRKNKVYLSVQYRFYSGYHMLHHGYVGYPLSARTDLQLGAHQVPFGNLPYGSHGWFFSIPYYLGLEDDYDAGIKLHHRAGPWDLTAAFYKNSEGSFSGSSTSSARYSYDVVGDQEEIDQGNLRVAREFGQTEVGLSGQLGRLYNRETDRFGSHYAAALHLKSDFGGFNLMAQTSLMRHNPARAPGMDKSTVVMGAYDFPYEVAADGMIHVVGLSYGWAVDFGPLEKLTVYNDFAHFDKSETRFNNSQMNTAGLLAQGSGAYIYFDIASGRSHPWIGPVWSQALADGPGPTLEGRELDLEWATRFNINFGYYF